MVPPLLRAGAGCEGVGVAQERRPPTLDELDSRLRQARDASRRGRARGSEKGPKSGLSQAIRMAVEMVAALILGAVVGRWLDSWLGTRPWLLIVFLFLGVAAGMLNAYRAARRMGAGSGLDR